VRLHPYPGKNVFFGKCMKDADGAGFQIVCILWTKAFYQFL
jgi:hypothetical protein